LFQIASVLSKKIQKLFKYFVKKRKSRLPDFLCTKNLFVECVFHSVSNTDEIGDIRAIGGISDISAVKDLETVQKLSQKADEGIEDFLNLIVTHCFSPF